MKRIVISALLTLFSVMIYSQEKKMPSNYVLYSGSGETTYAPAGGFDYSHHANYMMNIRSLTVKWNLRTLLGEPVVDGAFKWEAGQGTPADYLDYRDCVLLECSPVKGVGYMVYIRIAPTVPKSGAGFGFNTPGSPDWENIFCTRRGEEMTTAVPGFSAQTAKEIWIGGFYVTGVVLNRIGGSDGYLQPDKVKAATADASGIKKNATADTQGTSAQKAEYQRQKAAKEKAESKYKDYSVPFTLTVNDKDTVYADHIRLIKDLNPELVHGRFLINAINTEAGMVNTITAINGEVPLYEGWNSIHIAFTVDNFTKRSKLDVFYKGKSVKTLLSDDFDDGLEDGRWANGGYTSKWVGVIESYGRLLIKQGSEHTYVYVKIPVLQADINKKINIEFKSLMHTSSACRSAWVRINGYNINCKRNCDIEEKIKIVWDLREGIIQCYNNGELIYEQQREQFRSTDGLVQPEFTCYDFEKWEIDDLLIYQ